MIVAQKVWEFGKNTIWDDGKYYILEHIPTGEKAYFDRTDRVLKAVQQKIKQRGSVIYNKGLNCFAFQSKKTTPSIWHNCCIRFTIINRWHGYGMAVCVFWMGTATT